MLKASPSEFLMCHQRYAKQNFHHSSSKKSVGNYSPKHSKKTKAMNHSVCSIYEESKGNDCSKPALEAKKKASKPKPKRPLVLINKFQLSLASYIQDHKTEVKLKGTKRFSEKTGEYYLQNVLLKKIPQKGEQTSETLPTMTLKEAASLVNCIQNPNGMKTLKRRASEVLTKLPDDSLTPIPTINKKEIKNRYEGKELSNAERTAVHIRRLEYSNFGKKKGRKGNSKRLLSIILIQQWWKVIFSIIKLQKNYRGWALRRHLMLSLEREEMLIANLFFFGRALNRYMCRKGLDSIYDVLGIKRLTAEERLEKMNEIFTFWKYRAHLYEHKQTRGLLIMRLIKYQLKRNCGFTLNYNKSVACNEFIHSLIEDQEDMRVHKATARINKKEDDFFHHKYRNQLFDKPKAKVHLFALREYFERWLQFIEHKDEMRRIVLSMLNSKLEKDSSIRMTFGKLNKSSTEPTQITCFDTQQHHQTEGSQSDISSALNNREKLIYKKKTASFNSRLESKETIERKESIESSGLDANANRIEYAELSLREQKATDNLLTSPKEDKEAQTDSAVRTLDKATGTNDGEREFILQKIIEKQTLRGYFTNWLSYEKKSESLLFRKIKNNPTQMKKLIILGMKKYYFNQWNCSDQSQEIIRAIKSNDCLIKKHHLNRFTRAMAEFIHRGEAKINEHSLKVDLKKYIAKWRIVSHRVIQYDLLALELRSVLIHHSKQFLLKTLSNYTPTKEALKTRNSNLITYLQHRQFLKEKRMASNDTSQDLPAKKINYLKYAYDTSKSKPYSTQLEDEPLPLSRSFSLSQNHANHKNLFCYPRMATSVKKKANIGNAPDCNDSIHLIETNQEIFSPTIYSSQSFFLKKNQQEQSLHKSAQIHSDFVFLFDNPHPVIEDIHAQRIQVTKATIPLTKSNEQGGDRKEFIQQIVINKCSNDICPQLDRSEKKSPDQRYALPIDAELRSQLNVNRDEDLMRISLMNYGQIYSLNTVTTKHRRTRSEGTVANYFSLNEKKEGNSDMMAVPFKSSNHKDEEVFQLQEVNSSQFYHSPVKMERNNSQEDLESQAGVYTYKLKNSLRGKKPLFRHKRDSIDNIIASMSLFSSPDKENKDLSFNTHKPQPQIASLLELNQFRPTPSTSLFDTEVGASGRQLFIPFPKEIETIHNNHETISQIYQSNDPYNNLYSTQSNLMTNDNYQTCKDIIQTSIDYIQKANAADCYGSPIPNNRRSSCPKSLSSNTIRLKSLEEDDGEYFSRRKSCSIRGSNQIQWSNSIKAFEFFNRNYCLRLIKGLLNAAFLFRKQDNFLYLIKITFHYKRVNQLSLSKSLIDNWRMLLRMNRGKQPSQSHKNNQVYIEAPAFSRYKLQLIKPHYK